jgi:S-adenosyl-L-methionine hydrolase (adenosine-forming)
MPKPLQRPMIVTLLTDFGTADYFVAAMKGVILQRDPRIRIIDITHEVPVHDVESAAYVLFSCYGDFPVGTVHLAVVDPGVGSARRPLAIAVARHRFVGPDNGIFSYVLDAAPDGEMRRIDNPSLRREPFSTTFHGRDLFAPAAAFLAAGGAMERVGAEITDPVRLPPLENRSVAGAIQARILHVDRFGNCVTSLRREELRGRAWRIRVAGIEIEDVRDHYASGTEEVPFAIWGSSGYLEVSCAGTSAAARLGIRRGDRVLASLA